MVMIVNGGLISKVIRPKGSSIFVCYIEEKSQTCHVKDTYTISKAMSQKIKKVPPTNSVEE